MSYPTQEEIYRAGDDDLLNWYRSLPLPVTSEEIGAFRHITERLLDLRVLPNTFTRKK